MMSGSFAATSGESEHAECDYEFSNRTPPVGFRLLAP